MIEKLHLGDLLLVPTWEGPERPAYLGHLLTPDDFCLAPEQIKNLHVRKSENHPTCVLFNEGKVIGLATIDSSAKTSELIHPGQTLGQLTEVYQDQLTVGDPDPKTHLRLCRAPMLGLGFEIEDGKVKTMVLYPPVAGP